MTADALDAVSAQCRGLLDEIGKQKRQMSRPSCILEIRGGKSALLAVMRFLDFRSLYSFIVGSRSLQECWPVERYLSGLVSSWSPSCRLVAPSRLAWISMIYLARSQASTVCASEETALEKLRNVLVHGKGVLSLICAENTSWEVGDAARPCFVGGPSVFLAAVFLVRVVELNSSQPLSLLREEILSVTLTLLLHLQRTTAEVAFHVRSVGGCLLMARIYFASSDDRLWRRCFRVLESLMMLDPSAWHQVHQECFQPCLTCLRTGGDSHVNRAAIMIEGLVRVADEVHHGALDAFCRNPPCYSAMIQMTEGGVLQSLHRGLVRSVRGQVVMSALREVVTTPWCGTLSMKLQMLRDSGCVDDLVPFLEASASESYEAVSLIKLFTHLSEGGECINTRQVASCVARALGRSYQFDVDRQRQFLDMPFLAVKDRSLATFRSNCLRVLAVLAVGGIVPIELHFGFYLGILLDLVGDFKGHSDEEYPTWACALLLVLLKTDDLSARWLVGCEAFRVFRSVQQDAEAGCYMNSGRIYVPVSVSAFFRLDDSVLLMSWCCKECADLLFGMAVVGGLKRKLAEADVS